MRAFPNTVLQRSLAGQAAKPIQFLRFAFGGGEVRVTTAPMDVDWDGVTWQGIGGEFKLAPIVETPDDRGAQFTLMLSGVDQSILSAILAEQYIGRPVDLWLGWIAQGTNLVTNSSFETNLDGVGGNAGTEVIQRVADALDSTQYEALVSLVNSAGSGLFVIDGVAAAFFVVSGGQPYFARMLARSESAVVPMLLRIDWYANTTLGSYLSSSQTAVTLQPGPFQTLEVTGTAPATATRCTAVLVTSMAAGTPDIHIREIQLAPGAYQPYQPTDGAAILGGSVLDRPLGPMTFLMNGGFQIEEEVGAREGRTVTVQADLVSRIATLATVRGFRTNRTSHQAVYRSDQFFEFVPGLAGKQITWGAIRRNYGTGIPNPGERPRDRRG